MNYSYISADPGAKGAICAFVPDLGIIEFIDTTEQPHIIVKKLKTLHKNYPIKKIMIEEVHSIFGVSAKSNFNFGQNVGLLKGIFLSLGIGLDSVQPKVWQKFIGVKPIPPRKKDAPKIPASVRSRNLKNEVADICERLYPQINIRGPKGGLHDGKSDALMICHYNYLKYK